MAASAYAAALGEDGFAEVARQCRSKAAYLANQLGEFDGFGRVHEGEFFHEFVTECPIDPSALSDALAQRGILSGLPLEGGKMLWCATEMNTKAQMDGLIEAIGEVLGA